MTTATVIVDIDDVLYPWYANAHTASEAAGITNGVTPVTYAPHTEYGCTEQAWWDALGVDYAAVLSGDPFPDAAAALQRVAAAGVSIEYVTARGTTGMADLDELTRASTMTWLAAHCPPGLVTFARDKGAVATQLRNATPDGLLFGIDDRPNNVAELRAAGVDAYLCDAAWNRDSDLPRVPHVAAFAQIVLDALEAAA